MRLTVHRVKKITTRVVHWDDYWHMEVALSTGTGDRVAIDLYTDEADVAMQIARGAGVEILEGYPEGAEDDEEA